MNYAKEADRKEAERREFIRWLTTAVQHMGEGFAADLTDKVADEWTAVGLHQDIVEAVANRWAFKVATDILPGTSIADGILQHGRVIEPEIESTNEEEEEEEED